MISKVILTNLMVILIMTAKLATLGLPKKRYINIKVMTLISVHDVNNPILSHGLNYIADVVMLSNFDNQKFSNSMSEVIIISIL